MRKDENSENVDYILQNLTIDLKILFCKWLRET